MNYSPLYTFPSDLSTPKPEFMHRSEEFSSEEFSRYLGSLVEDINALGKQTESLRNENSMLKRQLEVLQKEKEKHVHIHAKEKHELEKTLVAEIQSKKNLVNELRFYKEKCESLENRTRLNVRIGQGELSSEKSLRSKKVKNDLGIKDKISKMEKAQREMKKKIKELEYSSTSKSGIIRWDPDY